MNRKMFKVALARQDDYSPLKVRIKLEKILSAAGILDLVANKKVLFKPNCTGAFLPEEGRTTHPTVLKETIKLLRKEGARVLIGESSSVGVETSFAYQVSGMEEAARNLEIPLINFKQSSYEEVKIVAGLVLDKIYLPREVLEADYLISLAKLKTNYVSTISCELKNLKGLLRDTDKKKFHHLGIAPALADLYSCLPQTIGIIDGILGSELYEPIKGKVLLASTDLIACDTLCAKIMGVEPSSVEHLRLAKEKQSPNSNYGLTLLGDDLDSVCTNFKYQFSGLAQLEEEYQIKISDGHSCSSCLGALYLSLKKARLVCPQLVSGLHIVLGCSTGETDENNENTLRFGNCAAKSNYNQNYKPSQNESVPSSSKGIYVPGCTPTTSDFIGGLFNKVNKLEKMKYS